MKKALRYLITLVLLFSVIFNFSSCDLSNLNSSSKPGNPSITVPDNNKPDDNEDTPEISNNPLTPEYVAHKLESNMLLGNPMWKTKDTLSQDKYYEVNRAAYSLAYNYERLQPNWVSWNLEPTDLGWITRPDPDPWTFDPDLPDNWDKLNYSDFNSGYNGFSKGHMCPNMDRNSNTTMQYQTFILSNIIPQVQVNNGGAWLRLEQYVNDQVRKHNKEAFIVSGPWGIGGYSDKARYLERVAGKGIEVPAFTWKVVLIINNGTDDIARIEKDSSSVEAIGLWMPNSSLICKDGDSYDQYLCSIDFIEEATGFDFFSKLNDTVENELEARNKKFDKAIPEYKGANKPENLPDPDKGDTEIKSAKLPPIAITKYYHGNGKDKFIALTNTSKTEVYDLANHNMVNKISSSKTYANILPSISLQPGQTVYLVTSELKNKTNGTWEPLKNLPEINKLQEVESYTRFNGTGQNHDLKLYFDGNRTIEIVNRDSLAPSGNKVIWKTIDMVSIKGNRPNAYSAAIRLYDIDKQEDYGWVVLDINNPDHMAILDGTKERTTEGIYWQPTVGTGNNKPDGYSKLSSSW